MMIVTLQTAGTLKPEMSVHGGVIKIDLGAILIEVDKEGFKNLMYGLIVRAAKLGIDILSIK